MIGKGFRPGETLVKDQNLPSSAGKSVCLSQWRPKAAARRTVVTVLLLHSQLMLCTWRRGHGHRKRIVSEDDTRPPRCRRRGLNLLAAIERAETLSFIPVFFVGGRLVDVVLKRAGGALPTGSEATRGVLARLADRHLERLHGRVCRVGSMRSQPAAGGRSATRDPPKRCGSHHSYL